MKSKKLFYAFLILAIVALCTGLFIMDTSSSIRSSILFLGILCGITAMVFKIASQLK